MTEISNPSARFWVTCAVVLAVGVGWTYFDRHSRNKARLAAAEARELREAELRRAAQIEREHRAAAAQEERERQRQYEARVAADRLAAMSPAERRREALRAQFDPYSGAHPAVEAALRARMHDPASYKHVETHFADAGPGRGMTVTTRYRGTNAFGALILTAAVAHVSETGRVEHVADFKLP